MRIGLAILSAILVVATGYMVFAGPVHRQIGVWEAAFVLAIAGFLVCVLRLLVALASVHLSSDSAETSRRRSARRIGGPALDPRAHQDPDEPHGA